MKFDEFKKEGSEAAVKAAGGYRYDSHKSWIRCTVPMLDTGSGHNIASKFS
jgi:hypothetical protein